MFGIPAGGSGGPVKKKRKEKEKKKGRLLYMKSKFWIGYRYVEYIWQILKKILIISCVNKNRNR